MQQTGKTSVIRILALSILWAKVFVQKFVLAVKIIVLNLNSK